MLFGQIFVLLCLNLSNFGRKNEMEQERIIDILSKIDKPVSLMESEIGIPKGVLAKAKQGKRGLPNKWAVKLEDYYKLHLTESGLNEPVPISPERVNNATTHPPQDWIKQVQDFCEKESITPSDLIESYKNKKNKKEDEGIKSNELNIRPVNSGLSRFQLELRKRKAGF